MCGTGARNDRSQLTGVWKTDVAKAFDCAVEHYDKLANVQRKVADDLAQLIIQQTEVSEVKKALEIGCGTGFLTSQMLPHFGATDWIVSDVSPKMVATCRQLMGSTPRQGCIDFRMLDGEQLCDLITEPPTFDLIGSSLAFQWLSDLPLALKGMLDRLSSGGQLHFATLADTNFRSFYDHFPLSGLEERAPKFPSPSAIRLALKDAGATSIEIAERRYSEAYPNLRSLLQHLKSIGAATPGQHSHSRETKTETFQRALRRAIRESHDSGHRAIADYHVLLVSVKKSG